MFSRISLSLLLLLSAVLIGCSGDETPATPEPPATPAEHTSQGWQNFEARHYSDALTDFNTALAKDADFGPALAGKGWCGLKLSVSSAGLDQAATDFSAALLSGETETYVLAGLASVRLAQGGLFLGQAASMATSVISEDPDFQFSHQGTIDTTDMILILAFSKAAAGEFSLALEQANLIQSSSIDLDNPGTWFVSNEQFSSFNAAVLARLYQLSEQYSG